MLWLYNSRTGAVQGGYVAPAAGLLLASGTGWHGPFKSKQEALDYYERNKAANPGWKAPAGLVENIQNIPEAAGDIVQGVTDRFNLENWFVRIAEIIIGVVLVGIGIAKLTGTTNAIAKAVKVAMP